MFRVSIVLMISIVAGAAASATPSFSGLGIEVYEPPRPEGVPAEAYRWTPDGSRAVWSARTPYPTATLWTSGAGTQELFPGKFETYATDISHDGRYVAGFSDLGGSGEQGMYRWEDGGGVLRPTYPESWTYAAAATAISGDGSTLVGYLPDFVSAAPGECSSPGCRWEAFEWRVETDELIPLGGFQDPKYYESTAADVTFDGSVIVGRGRTSIGSRAAIWFPDRQIMRVDEVLAALGIDVGGWQLNSAQFVSDDGLTIIGQGLNPSGSPEAWIAVIPEPSTALLVGAGLLAIGARRRVRPTLPTRLAHVSHSRVRPSKRSSSHREDLGAQPLVIRR